MTRAGFLKKIIFEKVITRLNALNSRHSLVGDTPFLDSKGFPWVRELESNWSLIRKELEGIIRYREELPNIQDISKEQLPLTDDNLWKTYILFAYGHKHEKSCHRCPGTTRVVENIPGMKTAMFSIIGPRKHIPAHQGAYKGLVRCHLGLIVPNPNPKCRISVGTETGYWEEGASLIFDDTFPHEVWNDTDEYRVVLLLDVVRPLPFPLSVINGLVIKGFGSLPLVKDGNVNYENWDVRFERDTA
ncbi:MAG: aspartyl/asparaginyl beta-hydroxylase domain-containing protein [Pyrinomonadaceae bacterium]|nr:aspartyl/asparaginyl beta-hydroxylase domain-containing protein [Pyrinomonadaceae bacterium]